MRLLPIIVETPAVLLQCQDADEVEEVDDGCCCIRLNRSISKSVDKQKDCCTIEDEEMGERKRRTDVVVKTAQAYFGCYPIGFFA